MSEYQYYEFQAVDRPLTVKEMRALRSRSSRAKINPSGFVNHYNWGNFKGDPDAWMEKYFDAFCYLANWGTRWFMLRLPRDLMPLEAVMAYRAKESMSFRVDNGHLILSFFSDEEQDEQVKGEAWMPALLPLRGDLLKGDFRSLYLGWLSGVKEEDLGEQTPEPPVPPGLDRLSGPLQTLADFLKIPRELLAAASEKSAGQPKEKPGEKQMAQWVAELAEQEKNRVLTQIMATGQSGPALELRRRFLAETLKEAAASPAGDSPRCVGRLLERMEKLRKKRRKKQLERNRLWKQVDELIAARRAPQYDAAVVVLKKLRDTAETTGQKSRFKSRMADLRTIHARKKALLARMDAAGF